MPLDEGMRRNADEKHGHRIANSALDWSAETWKKASATVAELVSQASTGWTERSPTPQLDAHALRDLFRDRLPEQGCGFEALLEKLEKLIPLCGYNGHPRWFGYITSSPDPIGVLADFMASALNQNNNLWRIAPAATSIELQTLDWLKEWIGFPADSEGIFTSGGQFANLVAHAVVRRERWPGDVRLQGTFRAENQHGRLRFYVSDQAHYCHRQALDLLGIGTDSLRLIASDNNYRMRMDALADAVRDDRAKGDTPVCVIATAGTVGVGAIDPIGTLREFTHREKLWLHVDGAYGAPAVAAPSVPADLKALRLADSLALDPHKWLYAPIDAGVTLIRKPGALSATFGNQVSYLDQRTANKGCLDLVDFTPENSRPFRALKVWLAIQAHGLAGYRESIERDLQLARFMAERIAQTPGLRLAAPVATSVVCWAYEPRDGGATRDQDARNRLQTRILEEMERRGIALLSKAVLHGDQTALRACFVNFRTRAEDVTATVQATADIGREIAGS